MALTGKFSDIPSGTLKATLTGRRLSAPFDMKALFSGGDCTDGEYRQLVRGTFKVDGVTQTHILCGSVTLDSVKFREDGCPPPGCSAYGWRDCPQHPFDKYLPKRSDGCTFEGFDAPGITGGASDKISMSLDFQAKLLQMTDGTVLASASWSVVGEATIPSSRDVESTLRIPEGLTPRVLVHRGEQGLIVSLAYPVDDPEAFERRGGVASQLQIHDGDGRVLDHRPLGPVEVGGSRALTRIFRFALAPGAAQPASVELIRGRERLQFQAEDAD